MENRRNYFLLNKESDYRRGYLENMDVLKNGIRVKPYSQKKGIFISRLLDSQQPEMIWHRFRFRGNERRASSVRLSVYAGNQRSIFFRDEEMDLDQLLQRRDVFLVEKLQCLSPFLQKQAAGQEDLLLHEVKGRYLWFLVEMYWQPGMEPLADFQVFFPRQSWIGYLPEIYEREDRDSFLERYLGIFQTMYEDVDERIREMPKHFDPETARSDQLIWLARWLGIDNGSLWPEEKLRKLLYRGVSLYRRRGTRQGLLDFVELYTGRPPYLVENHQIQRFRRDRRRFARLQRLYGSVVGSFTLLVQEEAVASRQEQQALIRLVEDIKPAWTEWRLVILKPYLFVDGHTYVGINSVLGRYEGLKLDGKAALPFMVLR